MEELEGIEIDKGKKPLCYKFTDIFKGFEDVKAVKDLFGKDAKKVLSSIKVVLIPSRWGGYFYVDDKYKVLVGNIYYIKRAEKRYLYLDIIHELVHFKQMMEGKKLFYKNKAYFESPSEKEAYKITIDEAKKLGMNREEIKEYLRVEWASEEELEKFINEMNV
ncbi:MAG: hypothetical protein QXL16_00970 [Candidatus Micrarchaeaceae archaeon]